jgi:hypothetical protein
MCWAFLKSLFIYSYRQEPSIELVELRPYKLLYICPDTSFLLTRDDTVTYCKLLHIDKIRCSNIDFMQQFLNMCARKDLHIIKRNIVNKYTFVELFINNVSIVDLLNNLST